MDLASDMGTKSSDAFQLAKHLMQVHSVGPCAGFTGVEGKVIVPASSAISVVHDRGLARPTEGANGRTKARPLAGATGPGCRIGEPSWPMSSCDGV